MFTFVAPKFLDLLSIFIKIDAITLWPVVVSREPMDQITINHERIHLKQQEELLVIGFYILYVYYWIRGMKKYEGSKRQRMLAYRNNPFEREAYQHQMSDIYTMRRKAYAWWEYK